MANPDSAAPPPAIKDKEGSEVINLGVATGTGQIDRAAHPDREAYKTGYKVNILL